MANTPKNYFSMPGFVKVGAEEDVPAIATLNKPTVFAGIAIRRTRITKLLSQTELAEKARLSPSYLSMVEMGSVVPSRALIYRIAQILDVPYDALVVEPVHLLQLREHLKDVADQDVFDAFDILSKERHRTT